MKLLPYTIAVAIVLVALFLGVSNTSAQSQSIPAQTGGRIEGTVYGYTMYDQLITLSWAQVTASNPQFQFKTSSGGGGHYGMYVPGGVYNLSVYVQGYTPQSMSVTVSDGSLSNVNFVLERSNVPIPEFPAQLLSALMIVAIASALLAKRATKRKIST
jgi:hypothetical protein